MRNAQPILLFELSKPGRRQRSICRLAMCRPGRLGGVAGERVRRRRRRCPEVAEPDVVRHFTNLSTLNMSVDTHFYPLGSCTMKYNSKRNERLAAFAGIR